MSNKSKFKVGDVAVRTVGVEDFKKAYPSDTVTVTGFTKEGYLLLNNEPEDIGGWFEEYFELYVEPENKVPGNMEIVYYQAYSPDGWVMVDRDSYELSRMAGWSTRILYTFKQE